MNPDEIIQLALVGIQSLVSLIAKVQANHQMNDAQLDAYINATDSQTRAMVQKFLAALKQPAASETSSSQPDASTGSE